MQCGGVVLLCLVVCSVEQCCSGKTGFCSMTAGLGEGGTAFLLFANSHDHCVTIPAPSTQQSPACFLSLCIYLFWIFHILCGLLCGLMFFKAAGSLKILYVASSSLNSSPRNMKQMKNKILLFPFNIKYQGSFFWYCCFSNSTLSLHHRRSC